MTWKKGPLPKDTYNWGGVVPVGEEAGGGFYFADFCGDTVKICPGDRVLKANEVAMYNNGLELPSYAPKSATRLVSAIIALILALLLPGMSEAQYQPPPVMPDYTAARAEAVSAGKPLVVFVGRKATFREVPGAVICWTGSIDNDATPRIVVSIVKDGYLTRFQVNGEWDLHNSASDAKIRQRIKGMASVAAASAKVVRGDCGCSFGGICRCGWKAGGCDCDGAKGVSRAVANPFLSSSDQSCSQGGCQAPADDRAKVAAGPQFNSSHRCPSCGVTVTVVSGRGPNGSHTHTCNKCWVSWYH